MADQHYGPGDFLSLSLSVTEMKATKATKTFQMTMNSHDLQVRHRDWSNAISKLHKTYGDEEKLLRNQMRAMDDKTSNEYFDLLSELEELQDEEDARVKEIESEQKDYEENVQAQNTSLETAIQAIDAQLESFQSAVKERAQGN